MKAEILQSIQNELARFKLDCFKSDEADIIFHKSYSDTWEDKIKNIEYKLYIGIHELDETIYVQERISEKDKDFTFKLKLNNDPLCGNKLYRKVKVVYIQDGKKIELEYNLKELLRIIKQIALNYNYQFKEVMMLGKIREAHDYS
jgi:hypothetical protein